MSFNHPKTANEARYMARKMCEEHWGDEKKPFSSVPWKYDDRFTFVIDAQNEIKKYITENNKNEKKIKINYTAGSEHFPLIFVFY